ncbi:MAG TPA: hypothetical protein P5555_03660 [Candidatus Paceibacterota bacterium]|nr:hypothetical protein [Verrucomicrobiota bacterium]HOX01531.1 hypothetical protein [Verrucomicrobiota bacterium]HRZ44269.1 hypothetical protein [Candidatus Paceibacterota bacterium]HRZ92993.1 hypothetical protein [Candidatus Paceibacterota bacterium]
MNAKPVIVLLVILCLALAAALIYGLYKTKGEISDLQTALVDRSNNWRTAETQLGQARQDLTLLRQTLDERVAELLDTSNRLVSTTRQLTKLEADSKAAAQSARQEIASRDTKITERDARIAELESERDNLTQRMNSLRSDITGLESQIADTEQKLAASEGDRAFLLSELKRLQSDKADLERQLNNLSTLREQYRRLREEVSVARRLEWIRQGLYGSTAKGAERLKQQTPQPVTATNGYPLNVELRQDGTVRITPLPSDSAPAAEPVTATNTPAAP